MADMNGSSTIWKVVTSSLISALVTFIVMWLTLGSQTITRVEAQNMIDAKFDAPMARIEQKQDQTQQKLDDLRERLARIEERLTR